MSFPSTRQQLLDTYGEGYTEPKVIKLLQKKFIYGGVLSFNGSDIDLRLQLIRSIFDIVDQNPWLLISTKRGKTIRSKVQEFMAIDAKQYFQIFAPYWKRWCNLFPPTDHNDLIHRLEPEPGQDNWQLAELIYQSSLPEGAFTVCMEMNSDYEMTGNAVLSFDPNS